MNLKSDHSQRSFNPQAVHFKALINKKGQMNVHGRRDWQNPFADLYHYFFSLSWPNFFFHIAAIYLLLNAFFGVLYFSFGVHHSLRYCFFLSVENMSAVDYGRVPDAGAGVATLMTIQAFLGLLTLAVITGLFYARFSRPVARIIFSNKAIISNHNGRPCLSFRIANERLNQIAEAHMSVHMTRNEMSLEGEHTRKFYTLKLERDHSLLFALSWTVRHYIDEHSPMRGMSQEEMRESQLGIVASLTGTDEAFSQPIIARYAYSADDIVYNRRFKDIINWHSERKIHIDLKSIHDLHEVPL